MPTDGLGRETIQFTPPQCTMCSTPPVPMTLVREAFDAWRNDTKIQFAFPEMTADDRELMISGTHPACWDAMFAGGDDDGEGYDD